MFNTKEELINLLVNKETTCKKVYKNLIKLYTSDKEKFYEVSQWLKENYPDFYKRSFKDLYWIVIQSNYLDVKSVHQFGFPLDEESLFLQCLNCTDQHEVNQEEIINYFINLYKEKNFNKRFIIQQLETYVENGSNYLFSKDINYLFLRNIYKEQTPKNPFKLDIIWFKTYVPIYKYMVPNKTNDIQKIEADIKAILFLYLKENNGNDEKLLKIDRNNHDFLYLIKEMKSQILKEKLDNNLDESNTTKIQKIKI